jgi:hypothetical protein
MALKEGGFRREKGVVTLSMRGAAELGSDPVMAGVTGVSKYSGNQVFKYSSIQVCTCALLLLHDALTELIPCILSDAPQDAENGDVPANAKKYHSYSRIPNPFFLSSLYVTH